MNDRRWTWVALLASAWLGASAPAWAQEADEEAAPAAGEAQDDDELSDALEATDDVFTPSEEIQADTEISFPSDI